MGETGTALELAPADHPTAGVGQHPQHSDLLRGQVEAQTATPGHAELRIDLDSGKPV